MNALVLPSRRAVRPWMLAGMFGFLPHLVAVLLATLQRPNFSHKAQYLSELGERGSATAALTNYLGILPTGILLACFGLGVVHRFRVHRAMAAVGILIAVHGALRGVAALFPCDPGCRPLLPSTSQNIHNVAATLAFICLTTALFIAAAWLRARRQGAAIVAVSYALGAVAVVAQALLVAGATGTQGLYQRLALGALQLWVALFAIHLCTHATPPDLAPGRRPVLP